MVAKARRFVTSGMRRFPTARESKRRETFAPASLVAGVTRDHMTDDLRPGLNRRLPRQGHILHDACRDGLPGPESIRSQRRVQLRRQDRSRGNRLLRKRA
jgi:hypothetical protein